MDTYDYEEAVKNDMKDFLEENRDYFDLLSCDSFMDDENEKLFGPHWNNPITGDVLIPVFALILGLTATVPHFSMKGEHYYGKITFN